MENKIAPNICNPERGTDRAWAISGATLLSEVSDILDIEFRPRVRYKTNAGFVMTELGYTPNEGDRIKIYGHFFQF